MESGKISGKYILTIQPPCRQRQYRSVPCPILFPCARSGPEKRVLENGRGYIQPAGAGVRYPVPLFCQNLAAAPVCFAQAADENLASSP